MTLENQNILEDFYAGNDKKIRVAVYEDEALSSLKDLTGAEVIYSIFDDNGVIHVTKTSADGASHIELTNPTNGECLVKLLPPDTAFLNGAYRHMLNVVDANDVETTVFTGRINIFRNLARRPRKASVPAYLQGA
jgi:hypothetical protein